LSQITYRSLGPNYDPLWGQGQNNFIADVDAVRQAILTRLNLFLAEWWSDLGDGTPYWQNILGATAGLRQQQAISLILQERILGTPFVISVGNVQVNFESSTRAFSFYAEVKTQFGTVVVTNNQPTPPNQGLPVIGLPNGQ
jgi:hypothetical protein